jgi:hypothetical protein
VACSKPDQRFLATIRCPRRDRLVLAQFDDLEAGEGFAQQRLGVQV